MYCTCIVYTINQNTPEHAEHPSHVRGHLHFTGHDLELEMHHSSHTPPAFVKAVAVLVNVPEHAGHPSQFCDHWHFAGHGWGCELHHVKHAA